MLSIVGACCRSLQNLRSDTWNNQLMNKEGDNEGPVTKLSWSFLQKMQNTRQTLANPSCCLQWYINTLLGTNMSPKKSNFENDFLCPRWNMLVSWRVHCGGFHLQNHRLGFPMSTRLASVDKLWLMAAPSFNLQQLDARNIVSELNVNSFNDTSYIMMAIRKQSEKKININNESTL